MLAWRSLDKFVEQLSALKLTSDYWNMDMDIAGGYREAPLTHRLQSLLAERIKNAATQLVVAQPHACPGCCCERFEREPLTLLDQWLGRLGRYRCEKCFVVTLHLPPQMLGAAQEPQHYSEPVASDPDEREHLFSMATRYATGNGESKDMGAAFTLFVRAARMGHVQAQYNVAVCYVQGITVTRDMREGADWMSRAARQGHMQAKQALPYLLKCMPVGSTRVLH